MVPTVTGVVRRNFAILSTLGLLIAGLLPTLKAALAIAAAPDVQVASAGSALDAAAVAQPGGL